jgi:hypothetical protein
MNVKNKSMEQRAWSMEHGVGRQLKTYLTQVSKYLNFHQLYLNGH